MMGMRGDSRRGGGGGGLVAVSGARVCSRGTNESPYGVIHQSASLIESAPMHSDTRRTIRRELLGTGNLKTINNEGKRRL